MLGLCQYQLNLNDRAMANIKAAKDLGIRKEEQLENVLQYHEGMLLLRKGDYERAIEVTATARLKGRAERSLRHGPRHGSAFNVAQKRARTRNRPSDRLSSAPAAPSTDSLLKKTDDAKKEYLALTQEFPDFPNVHYAFGRFLLTIQDTEEAVPAFQEEIKRNPTHIRARMQIAATHYRVDSADWHSVRCRSGQARAEISVRTLSSRACSISILVMSPMRFRNLKPRRACLLAKPNSNSLWVTAYAKAGRKEDAARARAAFRNLGGAKESASKSTTYGDQSPSLDHAAGPAPQSSERNHP